MPKRKRASKDPKAGEQEAQTQSEAEPSINYPKEPDPQSPTDLAENANITHFTVPFGDKKPIVCERHQPYYYDREAIPSLIFTHGAGGGITAPAVRDFARGFAQSDAVITWQGNMNLTSRVRGFKAVVEDLKVEDGKKVALGGRSMGARAAVLTALDMVEEDAEDVPGALVLVSWPLTAGKEGKREPERRENVLKDLPEGMDVLFVVGERDEQCDLEMLEGVRGEMNARSWMVIVKGADHGMALRQKDGVEKMRMRTGSIAAEWFEKRDGDKRSAELEWNGESGEIVWSGWKGN